jgi:acyl-coenzyme A thioesterase PaaI-like protein
MSKPSTIRKVYETVRHLPGPLKSRAFTLIFGRAVKFFGTAGLRFTAIEPDRAVIVLKNIKAVQNHLGTPHAMAMGLLVESATGALVGLNVPDSSVPVIKHAGIDYLKRAKGDLVAEARLTPEQIDMMQGQEKGEVDVAVTLTDSEGKEPIFARMIWAWTPKRR